MARFLIEGLKPMYKAIATILNRYEDMIDSEEEEEELEEAFGALNWLTDMMIVTQTTYEGMTEMQKMPFIQRDTEYVRGLLTPEEEEYHIKFHWDMLNEQEQQK